MTTDTNIQNGNSRKKVITRFIIYSLIFFVIALSLPIVIEYGDIKVFNEGGPIEWLQLLVLFFSAAVLLFHCRLKEFQYRHIIFLLSIILTAVGVRELDASFDELIPYLGWQLPMGFCIGGGSFCQLEI